MPSRSDLLERYEAGAPGPPLAVMRGQALRLEPGMAKAGARSFLELGCGNCLVLEELQARGHDVTGYEPASVASEHGADVSVYPRFDADLPGIPAGHYDAVIALGALERMPDAETVGKCLAELFRVARLFVVLGVDLDSKRGPLRPEEVLAHALRLGSLAAKQVRGSIVTYLFRKAEGHACSSST